MKRIIIISYDFPSNNGGIARLCGEIYQQCHNNGLPVLVITCAKGNEADDIIRLKGRRGIVDWYIYRCLKRHLHEGDVILTGTYHPDGLIGMITGYPTYMLAHGAELLPGQKLFRKKIWPFYRKWVLGKATKVVANSHYTANLVKKCNPKAKVIALPLAVDNIHFHPSKKKQDDGLLHLFTISRLEKFKAQDFIIQTISHLPEKYKQKIRLEIGGKGVYKPVLEQMVKDLHLEDYVHFHGYIPDDRLCDFYSENDIFILTTREEPNDKNVEGFGLVFLEAQACGTPTIGSRTGGIPDAVEEGNGGWLIEEDNEQQLQELLMRFIDNPKLITLESKKAITRVKEKFTWDKYFKKLVQILQNEVD